MSNSAPVRVQSIADCLGPQAAPVVTGARVVKPLDEQEKRENSNLHGAALHAEIIRVIRAAGEPLNVEQLLKQIPIKAARMHTVLHGMVFGEAHLLAQLGEWGKYRYCTPDMLPRKATAAAPAATAKPAAPQGGNEHPPRAQSREGDAASRAKQEARAAAVVGASNTSERAATGEGGQSASSPAESDARAKGECPKCGGPMTPFSMQCRKCYQKGRGVHVTRAAPTEPPRAAAPVSVAVPRQLARENCLRIGREIVSHLRANCTDLDEDHVLRLLIEQHEFSARMLEALPG